MKEALEAIEYLIDDGEIYGVVSFVKLEAAISMAWSIEPTHRFSDVEKESIRKHFDNKYEILSSDGLGKSLVWQV